MLKRIPRIVIAEVLALVILIPAVALVSQRATGIANASPAALVAGYSAGTHASAAPTQQVADASGGPVASTSPEVGPAEITDVDIVPVVQFRSALATVTAADAKTALAGTSKRFSGLVLVKSESDAILAALDLSKATPTKLVLVKDAAALAARLAKERGLLGFLRADAVGPSVRALAWNSKSLFGVDRVAKVSAWTLSAKLPAADQAFDPAALWTLAAAGDIMLDRGVYRETILRGKGVNFPWGGGRVAITGHRGMTSFGWPIPLTKRLGDAGAVKAITVGADLAFANHEGPAPVNARYHTKDTLFSFNQKLLPGLDRAGFDWVSLANNHIGDAGNHGVLETIAALKKLGIKAGGAGADETAARKPSIMSAGGVKVAVLGRDAIAHSYWAGVGDPGSAGLVKAKVVADIKAARKAGADVVIVYPHWGLEYHAAPTVSERNLAHAMIDAGADMIIGNHAHWAAAMESYKGKPIWYALGNFVFDQTWSEPTQEGLLLELTFAGRKLVQIRMHPLFIMDSSQPNLMDPAGSGKVVLNQVFKASTYLGW
jgi:hypothetical protein